MSSTRDKPHLHLEFGEDSLFVIPWLFLDHRKPALASYLSALDNGRIHLPTSILF